jgi:hypothetical protein
MGKNRLGVSLDLASYKSYSSNGTGPVSTTKSDADQMRMTVGYSVAGAMPLDFSVAVPIIAKVKRSVETAAGKSESSYNESFKHFTFSVRSIVPKKSYALLRLEPRNPEVVASTPAAKKSTQISELGTVLGGGLIFEAAPGTTLNGGGELVYLVAAPVHQRALQLLTPRSQSNLKKSPSRPGLRQS